MRSRAARSRTVVRREAPPARALVPVRPDVVMTDASGRTFDLTFPADGRALNLSRD